MIVFFMLTFVHYWYQLFISKIPCLNKRKIYFRLSLFTHSGEKHGEDIDRSLQEVVASDGDGHGRDKHQVTETEQQGGEELETVRIGFWVVCAPPSIPA